MNEVTYIPELPEKLNERLRNLKKGAYAEVKYKDKQHIKRERMRLKSHARYYDKKFTSRSAKDNYLCVWRTE